MIKKNYAYDTKYTTTHNELPQHKISDSGDGLKLRNALISNEVFLKV